MCVRRRGSIEHYPGIDTSSIQMRVNGAFKTCVDSRSITQIMSLNHLNSTLIQMLHPTQA